MGKVAIVTDSNSGFTQKEAQRLGIYVLPMPVYINGEMYYEDINLSQEEFYRHLKADAEISTSMPLVGDVMNRWESLLKEYDEIVHIPMSSGLSGSCSAAMSLAEEYEGQVFVVDNKRISVTQKQSVLDAKAMADRGLGASAIKERLLDTMYDSSIYISVETLHYLKKGGRLTPAVAAIGSFMHIIPVLQIQGEKLDSYAKCRTMKAARMMMLKAMCKDIQDRFSSDKEAKDINIEIAYTGMYTEEVDSWKQEVEEAFSAHKGNIMADPLSLSVSCHIGPGALAIACSKKIAVKDV
ncbi:MAG: DegV family protein [Lachnospiraceae bacterium]|nr:DegV family protein [Lachnospiraceae bacterium]